MHAWPSWPTSYPYLLQFAHFNDGLLLHLESDEATITPLQNKGVIKIVLSDESSDERAELTEQTTVRAPIVARAGTCSLIEKLAIPHNTRARRSSCVSPSIIDTGYGPSGVNSGSGHPLDPGISGGGAPRAQAQGTLWIWVYLGENPGISPLHPLPPSICLAYYVIHSRSRLHVLDPLWSQAVVMERVSVILRPPHTRAQAMMTCMMASSLARCLVTDQGGVGGEALGKGSVHNDMMASSLAATRCLVADPGGVGEGGGGSEALMARAIMT